uniref:Uncharacterized protein n=1 Tax=Biomphalaria glabrata TaxID=6526 RepID=A0A2C9KDW6_BIOGL
MRKETLLTRLENAELENINEQTNTFEISPNMIDVLLIMGEAYDSQTRERYTGPCYIPKTVVKLLFPSGQVPCPLMFFALKPSILSGPPSKSVPRKSFLQEDKEQRNSVHNVDTSTINSETTDNQAYDVLQNLDF